MSFDYELIGDDMYRVRNFFSNRELDAIRDEFSGYHPIILKEEVCDQYLGNFSGLKKSTDLLGDNLALIAPAPKIKLAIKKIIKPDCPISFVRVNTNIMKAGEVSDFHHDALELPNNFLQYTWTFMLCCSLTWDPRWDGAFCMQKDGFEMQYASYIPNDCILFRATKLHKGGTPNRFAKVTRDTIAWTFTSPGVKDH